MLIFIYVFNSALFSPSHELTERAAPSLEAAAWYLAIFSLMDVDSNTLSVTDGPTAEEIITLWLFCSNLILCIVSPPLTCTKPQLIQRAVCIYVCLSLPPCWSMSSDDVLRRVILPPCESTMIGGIRGPVYKTGAINLSKCTDLASSSNFSLCHYICLSATIPQSFTSFLSAFSSKCCDVKAIRYFLME